MIPLLGAWFLALIGLTAAEPQYQYFLTGDAANVSPQTSFGVLLAGGGRDQDAAFTWFLDKAGNGDIVILRASGADGYHSYLQQLRPQVNSVETFVFRSREASFDPQVLERIRDADGLFLAGGDQWNYIRLWKDTPVEDAIHELVRRGVPVGGTSAGLAVLGEFVFSAENNTVQSSEALANPFHSRVTLATGFLRLPHLECLITDSHFRERDRMGRLLVFLARLSAESDCGGMRGLGVDERTAVLLEGDGKARIVGEGWARFLLTRDRPESLEPGAPLALPTVDVYAVDREGQFDFATWSGSGGRAYQITVRDGLPVSNASGGSLY